MEDLSVPSHSLLHSFCIRPNAKFESQLTGEEVLLILRAHPITQVPWILNGLFILILLGFIDAFASSIFDPQQLFIFNLGVFAFVFAYYWFNFLSYFFNVGLITNKRVLDLTDAPFLQREGMICHNEDIQSGRSYLLLYYT